MKIFFSLWMIIGLQPVAFSDSIGTTLPRSASRFANFPHTYVHLKYESKCQNGKTLTPEYSAWFQCFRSSASYKSGKTLIFENVMVFDSKQLTSLTVKSSFKDPQLEACWKKAAETYLIKHPMKDLRNCSIKEIFGASSLDNDRFLLEQERRLNPPKALTPEPGAVCRMGDPCYYED